MIKKLFTDWKKAYGYFLLFILVFISFVLSMEFTHNGIDILDIISLIFVIGIFHIIFLGVLYGSENDEKKRVENHSLTLDEFSKEYEITEEKALQLLKEGKLEGTISFKTYPLRDKTKEEIQSLLK